MILYEMIDEKFILILTWAEQHPEFDESFVMNLKDKFDRTGSLTRAQAMALDNIIEKWRIE